MASPWTISNCSPSRRTPTTTACPTRRTTAPPPTTRILNRTSTAMGSETSAIPTWTATGWGILQTTATRSSTPISRTSMGTWLATPAIPTWTAMGWRTARTTASGRRTPAKRMATAMGQGTHAIRLRLLPHRRPKLPPRRSARSAGRRRSRRSAARRNRQLAAEAEVAEGLVALADRLLEPLLRRQALPVEALRRVPCDAVEEDAERLGRLEALRVEGLVDEQLVHDELVDRDARYSLDQRLEPLVE